MAEVATLPGPKPAKMGPLTLVRALRSILTTRAQLGHAAGLTYEGARDVYTALGYKKSLSPEDYWARYERNEVAARVVEAFPEGTWRGNAQVYENEDPKVETEFEKAWKELSTRLRIWPTFLRTDILAGLGRYATLFIGAPGDLKSPLPRNLKPTDISYLMPYSERDVTISEYVTKKDDPRFGEAQQYFFKRFQTASELHLPAQPTYVHWSRVIHVAEGLLDDNVHGQPRMKKVWNRLDDLEKVVGSGSEAFWLRAHQGYQFNLDKEVELGSTEEEDLADEIEEFMNGIRRAVRTRGVDLKALGSDVADFKNNVLTIIGLIAAGTKIPQRILMGSEQGQLASQQDRVNWAQRVQDRRTQFAEPYIVRPFVDRLITHGALPPPKSYQTWWPEVFDLSDDERAVIAGRWAEVNQKNKRVTVTVDEIRDRIFGMPPLTDEQIKKENERMTMGLPTPPSPRTDPPTIKGNEPTRSR